MEDKKCGHCGKLTAEVILVDGINYCSDCIKELFYICERCGAFVARENAENVRHCGRIAVWCPDCAQNHAQYCRDCDELFDSDYEDYAYVDDDIVCRRCLNSNYYYCECCDEYVREEDWNSEEECCNKCAQENKYIGAYHSTDYDFFQGQNYRKKVWQGLGVELEIDRNDYDNNQEQFCRELLEIGENRIYLEHDGSLNYGFEIISHPHTFPEFEKIEWQKILEKCKEYGYRSHDIGTCGLHIHFSRTCFGRTLENQKRAISKIIYFYEKFWDEILKLSRRTNSQASDWAYKYCINTRKEARRISKKGYDASRYYAVNLSNSETIEFRLGRGTLNPESFFAWIDFCCAIVNNSKRIVWADIDNTELWLKGIKPSTRLYMNTKGVFAENMDEVAA